MLKSFPKRYLKLAIGLTFFTIVLSFILVATFFRDTFMFKKSSVEDQVLDLKTKVNYDSATVSAKTETLSSGEITKVEKAGQVIGVSQKQNSSVYLGFAFESRSSSRIAEVEGQIGRGFDLLMTYTQWGNPPNSTIDANFFAFFNTTKKTPIISWEPWDPGKGVDQSAYKLTNITAGNFDNYIRAAAGAIKNYGKPVFLRFAHEMNGNWYPWGGTVNGNSVADYIAAYRHVHDIFTQEQVSNVTWIWCPDTWSFPNFKGNDLTDYYPGASYVDWVGLDGYNFGTAKSGQVWQSFTHLFSSGYTKVATYNKPIMIAETASTESGGNKGAWIAQAFGSEIPKNFPKIKALIWFNINKETDWDINSSQNSISQFKTAVNNSIYSPALRLSGSKIISP